jgi:DNA-directed RNA polymerase subunit beta
MNMPVRLSPEGFAYPRPRLQLGQKAALAPPCLTDIQKISYARFLKEGVESALAFTFPIVSSTGHIELSYVGYKLEDPEHDEQDCITRGVSYASALKVTLRLTVYDRETGIEGGQVQQIKEKELYLCEIPLMTKTGSFIYNGTVRVVVSQMHRSPGVIFEHDKGRTLASGKLMYKTRVIPYRGAWLDIEFYKECLYMRIDRRKKMPATILFRALGFNDEEILSTFFQFDTLHLSGKKVKKGQVVFETGPDRLRGNTAWCDVFDKNGNVLVKKGQRFSQKHVRQLKEDKIEAIASDPADVFGMVLAENVVDTKTGHLIASANSIIDAEIMEELLANKNISSVKLLWINELRSGAYISETLRIDPCKTAQDAWFEIYRMMRPGEPPTETSSKTLFHDLFFNAARYDLSSVGRMKLNYRLGLTSSLDKGVLCKEDILAVVKQLVAIRDGYDEVDDIDNLGNRRVRSVGELLENQLRAGLARMDRSAKDRLSLNMDIDDLVPQNLINCNPVIAAVNDFFALNPLSQYADMVNPLAEITHKRRISALGQGGLTRDRAGFEVRDVHHTHYGRLCPVETPEGQNIGLINSAAVYARANEFGFLETPFYRVHNAKVTDEVVYLSAIEEGRSVIVQASTPKDPEGVIQGSLIPCRHQREFTVTSPDKIDFIDVAPNQIVSAAASLIPFMEHDDGPRVLMGSNMQRQAVPLLKAEKPLVGTGIESLVASDSGATINALRDGEVVFVDASRIVVKVARKSKAKNDAHVSGVDVYALNKFSRSNHNTCIDQKPIVSLNQRVKTGEVLADGVSVDRGELALGQNVLIAFMPWRGYNHEDSIVISERLVRNDSFCSIHIQELVCTVRETALGNERLTGDIPNINEHALSKLDESGIVYVGADVVPGDILVGKIAPKGETQLTPEEKLLRAIFGEKASDVRDVSLRVPSGASGVVTGVKIFTREGAEKDQRTLDVEEAQIKTMVRNEQVECDLKAQDILDQIKQLVVKEKIQKLKGFKKGSVLTASEVSALSQQDLLSSVFQDDVKNKQMESLCAHLRDLKAFYKARIEKHEVKVRAGDALPAGVIKTIKVYLAVKRRLQPGDKMAGRHGNKGCISIVVPEEDMPCLEDGTSVDMVLNPLGVPSRMNVGQVLEIHLGAAAKQLGFKLKDLLEQEQPVSNVRSFLEEIYAVGIDGPEVVRAMSDNEVLAVAEHWSEGVPMASPVFAGASEEQIKALLRLSGLSDTGQATLYDGRTGEAFDRSVTVGYMYMLKLNHLVDDKMHARSTGSYSLVTQQPLGGKAQFGGQRFGEMEVWALQAYGAAYTLQEMLTVKSDDVRGRSNMYKSIINREYKFTPNVPDSFKVLMKEIQALGINIQLEQD